MELDELIRRAEEIESDEVAERVERIVGELTEIQEMVTQDEEEDERLGDLLKEETEMDADIIDGFDVDMKREISRELGITQETANRGLPMAVFEGFTASVPSTEDAKDDAPVAGRSNWDSTEDEPEGGYAAWKAEREDQ